MTSRNPPGFLRLFAVLGVRQALALGLVAGLAIGWNAINSPRIARATVEMIDCAPLPDRTQVSDAGVALGAPRHWLVDYRADDVTSTVTLRYSAQLPAAELAVRLGCRGVGRADLKMAMLPGSFAVLALMMPVGLLGLALAHASTRQLLRATRWRDAWRAMPRGAVPALVALLALQMLVGFLFPGFLADVVRYQSGLLRSPGVLLAMLLGPFAEELWFRATALRLFADGGWAMPGLVVTSIGFGVLHGMISGQWTVLFYYWTVLSACGALLGWVWLRSRNVASTALLHYLNNLPGIMVALAATFGLGGVGGI